MTSKIKVDNINKVSDDSNIIKKCGTTTTIGSGASNPIVVDGSAITLGRCGGTVALASGATQTGFGRTGTVDWQTTPKTATFTAANGEGYFANTSGGAFTMNLPAGSAGAIVSVQDYNNTFDSNALSIVPNGSEKINGGIAGGTILLSTEGEGLTLVYVDGTVGWRSIQDSDFSSQGSLNLIASVSGSGNTLTTAPCCANVKIATFTGPGDFTVSQVSATAAENTVGYLIVAGGGGGGSNHGGGGGAGGFREGRNAPIDNFTASPLVANAPTNAITVTAQSYPVVVGAGGTAPGNCQQAKGSNSSFGGISSTGGGSGVGGSQAGQPGGSGGGAGGQGGPGGGNGNTPSTTPAQGTGGGCAPNPDASAAGGGGAVDAGSPGGPRSCAGGAGGDGTATSITGSPVTRAGGGGGGNGGFPGPGAGGTSGPGGGGKGGGSNQGTTAGTANTGGGGGGGQNSAMNPSYPSGAPGGNGGSGVVIIRYKFQ